MLFNEVYGSYYKVIAAILTESVSGELTDKRISEIIREKAFGESVLTIPTSLRDGSWPLLTRENATPLEHTPSMIISEISCGNILLGKYNATLSAGKDSLSFWFAFLTPIIWYISCLVSFFSFTILCMSKLI